jgi:hypothetical protein
MSSITPAPPRVTATLIAESPVHADSLTLVVLPFHYGVRVLCLASHLRRLQAVNDAK